MWSVGNEPVHIYLGTRRVMVSGATGLQSQAVNGLAEAFEVLRTQLQGLGKRSRPRLWLSGGLCRPFILDALPGLASRDEVHRVAAATAAQRTGLQAPCRLWIEPRPVASDRVVVAMHARVYDQLHDSLRGAGHAALSVRPWWAELLRGAAAKTADAATSLAVRDCDSVTLLLGAGAEVTLAATYAPVADDSSAKAIVARTVVSSGLANGQVRFLRLVHSPQRADGGATAWAGGSAPDNWAEVVV